MCFRDSECCEMITCRRCNHGEWEEGMTERDWSDFIEYLVERDLQNDFGAHQLLSSLQHYLAEYSRPFISSNLDRYKTFKNQRDEISLLVSENYNLRRRAIKEVK